VLVTCKYYAILLKGLEYSSFWYLQGVLKQVS
jgi:hypothetical protein